MMKVSIARIAVIALAALLLAGEHQAAAQEMPAGDSIARFKDFEQKLQQAYAHADRLAFQVKYRYANEGQPQAYLDSVSGEVQMDRGRSRTVIDGMETVFTGHYAIQVMQENKTIYLAATRPTAIQNPLPMLDSVFRHVDGIKTSVEKKEASDILTLDFPPGQTYSRMQLVIDDRSGYLRKVEYALNTAPLVGQEMIESPGHPAPYQSRGRIEILFTDYQHGQFDERIFREDNFFTRIAGAYQPAGRYKDYHLYLASSNL
jgi:hypothetical protein